MPIAPFDSEIWPGPCSSRRLLPVTSIQIDYSFSLSCTVPNGINPSCPGSMTSNGSATATWVAPPSLASTGGCCESCSDSASASSSGSVGSWAGSRSVPNFFCTAFTTVTASGSFTLSGSIGQFIDGLGVCKIRITISAGAIVNPPSGPNDGDSIISNVIPTTVSVDIPSTNIIGSHTLSGSSSCGIGSTGGKTWTATITVS